KHSCVGTKREGAEEPKCHPGKPGPANPPLVWSSICLAELSRDRKPQEDEPEENKQRLKDEVHFCIRKVMEAKDPMDPDDIEAQDEACARERAAKERGRGRSLAPKQKPDERGDRGCEYCDLSSRRSDRIQRERKAQIGWLIG